MLRCAVPQLKKKGQIKGVAFLCAKGEGGLRRSLVAVALLPPSFCVAAGIVFLVLLRGKRGYVWSSKRKGDGDFCAVVKRRRRGSGKQQVVFVLAVARDEAALALAALALAGAGRERKGKKGKKNPSSSLSQPPPPPTQIT
jgi:hypothetical protein